MQLHLDSHALRGQKKKKGPAGQDAMHRRRGKDHPDARYVCEDVILKVNPPASGAPADAM